jgi:hypothetical protein
MESLVIYRELADPSPDLVRWLEARDQLFVVQDPRGVEHSYIDNDAPRDSDITDEIIGNKNQPGVVYPGCTKGFAVFTADGDYVASYATLDKAIRAKASARIVTSAEIEGVEEDEEVSWNSAEASPRSADGDAD